MKVHSHYNGNINLRSLGFSRIYTDKEVVEFKKSKDDIFHFLQYCKIISLDDGIIPFTPRDYQIDCIKKIQENRNTIILAARQAGKSVQISVVVSHFSIFNKTKTIAILAQNHTGAKELLEKIKLSIELLPEFLKPTILDWNKTSIKLGNGSRIITSSSNGDGIRGRSIDLLILDEFAFINNAEEFMASVYPVIASSQNSKIIIISTPNGLNTFYDIYRCAELGINGFAYKKITYKDVPHYNNPEWVRDTIAKIGIRNFKREFECDFAGSSNTLIEGGFLQRMIDRPPRIITI